MDDEFGTWTTLGERIQELHDRLVAWMLVSVDDGLEIWKLAHKYFVEAANLEDNPLMAKKTMAVEAFERALSDYDTIWVQTKELEMELEDVDFDEEL